MSSSSSSSSSSPHINRWEREEVRAARGQLRKRIFNGDGPRFRHLMTDAEYGHYCAEWFLRDGDGVVVLYDDLSSHRVRISEVFNATAMRQLFVTWLRRGAAAAEAEAEAEADEHDFAERVLFVFSLFASEAAANGIPLKLRWEEKEAADDDDFPIPLQAWLLLLAIENARFCLADYLTRGYARLEVAPIQRVVDAAASENYRWLGMVWRSRLRRAFFTDAAVGGGDDDDGKLFRSWSWGKLLAGDGFGEKFDFLVTRVLPALSSAAALTALNVLPQISLPAPDADKKQHFLRSEFERFLDYCEGVGRVFTTRDFVHQLIMREQPR